MTIKGKFFGAKKGKVYIGEKSCKVVSWTMDPATSDSEVKFIVPKGLPSDLYELKGSNKVGGGKSTFTID